MSPFRHYADLINLCLSEVWIAIFYVWIPLCLHIHSKLYLGLMRYHFELLHSAQLAIGSNTYHFRLS
jgi:hypothetical protein